MPSYSAYTENFMAGKLKPRATGVLAGVRSQPIINRPITTVVRAASRVVGFEPYWHMRLMRHLPRTGLIEASLPGGRTLRMWSEGDDDIASAVYYKGWSGYEPETSELFFDHARTANVILDIGAHVGYFALLAAHANHSSSVFAFEPHERVYERLVQNCRLNDAHNCTCARVAIGSSNGEAELVRIAAKACRSPKDLIPTSSSLSREFMESIVDARKLESAPVNEMTIDEFVSRRRLPTVDLVKVDTEGTEDAVLRGMSETLARDRPTIFCEVLIGRVGSRVESVLQPLDYSYYLLTDRGAQARAHIRPEAPWRNYMLVPSAMDARREPP